MKENEKEIDHLTRDLMRGTAEQPPASLNARIMSLIMQEKRRVYTYYIKKRMTPAGIFGLLVAYMLCIVGVMEGANQFKGDTVVIFAALKNYFPVLLTVASGISCFFLFTQLDNWLKRGDLRQRNLPTDAT